MPPLGHDACERILERYFLAEPLAPPSNYQTIIRLGHLGTRVSTSNTGWEPNFDPHLDRIREHRRTRAALQRLAPDSLATLAAYYDTRQWPPAVTKSLGPLAGVARLILDRTTPVDGPLATLPRAQRCPGSELAALAQEASKGQKKAKGELASLKALSKQAVGVALDAFGAAYADLLAQEKEDKIKRLSLITGGLK